MPNDSDDRWENWTAQDENGNQIKFRIRRPIGAEPIEVDVISHHGPADLEDFAPTFTADQQRADFVRASKEAAAKRAGPRVSESIPFPEYKRNIPGKIVMPAKATDVVPETVSVVDLGPVDPGPPREVRIEFIPID